MAAVVLQSQHFWQERVMKEVGQPEEVVEGELKVAQHFSLAKVV